jgi:hypothetical protein
MAYRFTNTDKWNDSWFTDLKPMEKLLFVYLCDNCDIAGFIEINTKRWASDIGIDRRGIEGAMEGLRRGLIFSDTEDCVYIRTFLKHQKNYPLNSVNKAHKGIYARFDAYAHKFGIEEVESWIEGALKGLRSPTGNGIGNGILVKANKVVNNNSEEKEKKIPHLSDFYNSQITAGEKIVLKTPEAKDDLREYKRFIMYLYDYANIEKVDPAGDTMCSPRTNLLSIKRQLKFIDFARQFKKSKTIGLNLYEKLDAMENSPKVRDRIDFNLTLNTWLKPYVK